MQLQWDKTGEHYFQTGVDKVVLFTMKSDGTYNTGVAWSGVTSIEESPDGGDANDFYADNIKYLAIRAIEEYDGSITAYQSPEEFDECDGIASLGNGVNIGQQVRKPFALSWQTRKGNDTESIDYGYEIHIMYNATASPSSKTYETVNDSPEPSELSWDFETTPVEVGRGNLKPTSHVIIDAQKIDSAKLTAIENSLYGTNGDGQTEGTASTLLLPADIYDLLHPTNP